MRDINKIIVHHTASSPMSVREYFSILYNHHVNVLGYQCIGYHYIIDIFGNVKECRPITREGAHCYGQNKDSIGIAFVGNFEKTALTRSALSSFVNLVNDIEFKYNLSLRDKIKFHSDFRKTLCPGRNVKNSLTWYYSKVNRYV